MAPRGLSAEEKRIRLMELFHETRDFFQLKELEKLAPKMKGIVSQSVKEVLQGLVDDGLVQADKIGSSNFFWSFPSQRGAMMVNRLNTAKNTHTNLQGQINAIRSSLISEEDARHESAERTESLAELANLLSRLSELEVELSQYGSCDPVKIEEKRRAMNLAHEAAIRWTDNVVLLMAYFVRQHNVEMTDIRQYLGISDDFDDLS